MFRVNVCATLLASALGDGCVQQRFHTSPHSVVEGVCQDLGFSQVFTTPAMSQTDADDLYDEVTLTIKIGLQFLLQQNCTASHCPSADVSGCLLRFAGHDFMDFMAGSSEKGGSDGCIDFDHPDNKGLMTCFGPGGECGFSIAEHYGPFCGRMSLADFIVIAAEATMHTMSPQDSAASHPEFFKAGFQFGRTTRVQCPESGKRMPAADQACRPVEETFHQRMGLSWKESVALMGVHTLGRVNRKNSKFVGWWSDPSNSRIFNNNYYKSMLSKGWSAFITRDGPWQWIRSDVDGLVQFNEDGSLNDDKTQIMLDSDLCLGYTIMTSVIDRSCCFTEDMADGCNTPENCCSTQTHPILSETSFTFGGPRPSFVDDRNPDPTDPRNFCDRQGQAVPEDSSVSGTGDYVKEFALDQAAWVTSFLQAWRHATTNGFTPTLVTTSTTTSTTTSSTLMTTSTTASIATSSTPADVLCTTNSLNLNDLIHSNLGGHGPDSGDEGMLFANVLPFSGQHINLLVTATGSYRPKNTTKNKVHFESIVYINLLENTEVNLMFSFVSNLDNSPVVVDPFMMTFLDVDSSSGGIQENVMVKGFSEFRRALNTQVKKEAIGAATLFSSTKVGKNKDDPRDVFQLTTRQMKQSVAVIYPRLSHFHVNLALLNSKSSSTKWAKNFQFTGTTSLLCNSHRRLSSDFMV